MSDLRATTTFSGLVFMMALALAGCDTKPDAPVANQVIEPETPPMSAEPAEPTGVMNAEPVTISDESAQASTDAATSTTGVATSDQSSVTQTN